MKSLNSLSSQQCEWRVIIFSSMHRLQANVLALNELSSSFKSDLAALNRKVINGAYNILRWTIKRHNNGTFFFVHSHFVFASHETFLRLFISSFADFIQLLLMSLLFLSSICDNLIANTLQLLFLWLFVRPFSNQFLNWKLQKGSRTAAEASGKKNISIFIWSSLVFYMNKNIQF